MYVCVYRGLQNSETSSKQNFIFSDYEPDDLMIMFSSMIEKIQREIKTTDLNSKINSHCIYSVSIFYVLSKILLFI